MFFSRKAKGVEVVSPVQGEAVALETVNDPVFSQKMMGEGVAIKPAASLFVSPIEGEIVVLAHTNHAFGVRNAQGMEVLVHIGVNTVNQQGKGFYPLKAVGDSVKKGEPIIDVDRQAFDADVDLTTMVISTSPNHQKLTNRHSGAIDAGALLFYME